MTLHHGWLLGSLAVLALGCSGTDGVSGSDAGPTREPPASEGPALLYSVTVETPASLTSISTGLRDSSGRTIGVQCRTCHAMGEPPHEAPSSAAQVGGPHADLQFDHGHLPCASCHDATRADRLHLADGRPIAMVEAKILCGQCHGPQLRDYDHGSHGGMTGYWDLRRGPRRRNHCVSCHDPHDPHFPAVLPMPGPRDRFLPGRRRGRQR